MEQLENLSQKELKKLKNTFSNLFIGGPAFIVAFVGYVLYNNLKDGFYPHPINFYNLFWAITSLLAIRLIFSRTKLAFKFLLVLLPFAGLGQINLYFFFICAYLMNLIWTNKKFYLDKEITSSKIKALLNK